MSLHGKNTQWCMQYGARTHEPGQLSRHSDSLRVGLLGYRIPLGARFSAPVQTCPGTHPASQSTSAGLFLGIKRPERNVVHKHHLVTMLRKEYSCTSIHPVGLRDLFQGDLYTYNRPLISFVTTVTRRVTQHHVCGQTWPSHSTVIVTYYLFCGIP